MPKSDFIENFLCGLHEAIVNNSDIEADLDDTVLFSNVYSVAETSENTISVVFNDGETLTITVT